MCRGRCGGGHCLGQKAVEEKSSKITAILLPGNAGEVDFLVVLIEDCRYNNKN